MRASSRRADELRPVSIERDYTRYAEGSVLISCGHTKVLCNASISSQVPSFLRGSGRGWVTAEYNMLPRATKERKRRVSSTGKIDGRSAEIQRLIGRSLRSVVNLKSLGECQIILDCDVIQADGGTRTTSITGSYVAMIDALRKTEAFAARIPDIIEHAVAGISVGIGSAGVLLDLDGMEDNNADADLNIVMNSVGKFVEIQGTAERRTFSEEELQQLIHLAKQGLSQLFLLQQEALG